MSRAARRFRLAVLLLLSLSAVQCQDDLVKPDQPALPEEITTLPPGIHPVLSIPGLENLRPGSDAVVRVHLYAVDVPDVVASYQGELRFDPSALEVKGGAFPDGILGAWNETTSGVIRFAGATLEGVGTRPALELNVRVHRPLKTGDFQVALEEVVATEGFRALTDQVPAAAALIVTGARLDLNGR